VIQNKFNLRRQPGHPQPMPEVLKLSRMWKTSYFEDKLKIQCTLDYLVCILTTGHPEHCIH
jgi:hypothetical protein